MASSRKSPRNGSPATIVNPGLQNSALDANMQQERPEGTVQPAGSQTQPPISTPEDAREVARMGMREGMNQFRTAIQPTPQSKVKLRVKQYDPSRRSYYARNDDAAEGKETPKASDRGNSTRKSTTEKVEDKNNRQPIVKEKQSEKENTPKTSTVPQSLPTRPPSAREAPAKARGFDPSRLGQVVDSAAERARELGNETLGQAIKVIYEDGLSDTKIFNLLLAVLSQQQTKEQSEEFQGLIKMARKRLKAREKQANTSTSTAKSKPASTTQTGVAGSRPKATPKSPVRRTRQSTARNESSSANATSTHTPTPQPQTNGKMTTLESKKSDEPPAKRVKRSRSGSSTSTLSSTHSLDIEPDVEMSDDVDSDAAGGRKSSSAQPTKGNHQGKSVQKKTPGQLGPPKLAKEAAKDEADDKEREEKKRKLLRTDFDCGVTESRLRSSPKPRLDRIRTDATFPNLTSGSQSGRGNRRDNEDLNSPASSLQGDLLVPPPPEARRTSRSRAATPNVHRTRGTQDRGKARIKESPMKKKNGVVAGIAPRSTRAKDGAAGAEQTTDDEGENVDFCSSCGDQGKLLCCDGCVRSFHFKCLDPPMDEQHPPEGSWFCQICYHRRNDLQPRLPRGLFNLLDQNLLKHNPVAFCLPPFIRNYFEGVGSTDDGEYVEVSSVKTRNNRVPGYDEVQKHDNLRLKDAKNQVILCFRCGLSSLGKREIISCDYCGLHWHLDCLNPPLANPPFRDPQNRAKYKWMCPAHADNLLTTVGICGRLYKTRRPKNAEIIDTQLRRGFKSNGLVEIELDPFDEDEDDDDDDDDEMIVDDSPKIYRVTETNVRLDFNDRLRRDWEAKQTRIAEAEHLAQQAANENARSVEQSQSAFDARSAVEQDAMLGLCQLAGLSSDSGIEPDQVQALVTTLLSEAPDDVLALLTEKPTNTPVQTPLSIPPNSPPDANPEHGKTAEIRQLLLLQELIRRKLAENGHP